MIDAYRGAACGGWGARPTSCNMPVRAKLALMAMSAGASKKRGRVMATLRPISKIWKSSIKKV